MNHQQPLAELRHPRPDVPAVRVAADIRQVRLSSSLAKPLAQAALPVLESAVQPVVEEVVRILAASSTSPIRSRKRRAPIKIGSVQPRPISKVSGERIASACRIRGLVLDDSERTICDECLPDYDRERTEKQDHADDRAFEFPARPSMSRGAGRETNRAPSFTRESHCSKAKEQRRTAPPRTSTP